MTSYGYDITIREVMNGFVVKVGCEHIVISGKDMPSALRNLCNMLKEYLNDRSATEKKTYKAYRPNRSIASRTEVVAGGSGSINLP